MFTQRHIFDQRDSFNQFFLLSLPIVSPSSGPLRFLSAYTDETPTFHVSADSAGSENLRRTRRTTEETEKSEEGDSGGKTEKNLNEVASWHLESKPSKPWFIESLLTA